MKPIHSIILIVLITAFAYYSRTFFEKKAPEIHYHAGFEIYVNGKRMDLTALEYMDVKPCGNDSETKPEAHPEPEVHLHDGIPNIVHVHGKEAQWKNLFEKLQINVSTASVEAYFGQTSQPNVLEMAIKPYDQVIFFVNSPGDHVTQISESLARIPDSYIKNVEKQGENCTK